MTGAFGDIGFQAYAVSASIVGLQLLGLAFLTGTYRVLRKKYVNPEDARFNKGEQVELEPPDVARVKRAHQNAIENAIPFFAIGALYAATGPTKEGAMAYFGTFTAMRLLHSVFYIRGIQPFRTLSFVIGALATIGMAVHVLRAAL